MNTDNVRMQKAMDAALKSIREQFKDIPPVKSSEKLRAEREEYARRQEEKLQEEIRATEKEMKELGITDYNSYHYYKKGFNLAQSGGYMGLTDGSAYGPYYADFQNGYYAGLK